MHFLRTVSAFLTLAAIAAWPAPGSLIAQRLQEPDLRVAGLPFDADTGAVRRTLGAPSRVGAYRDDDGRVLLAWHYPDLAVTFDATGHGYRWQLTGPRYATTRGVKPGDLSSRVRSTYGRPSVEYPHDICYALRPAERGSAVGIDFVVAAGVVRAVHIGNLPPAAASRGPADP